MKKAMMAVLALTVLLAGCGGRATGETTMPTTTPETSVEVAAEAEVKAQAKKQQVGNPISENKHKLEKKLEILKAERIRQYEAYAENIITKEVHLKSKAELAAEIDRITAICTQAQEMLHTENELAEQISKTCDSADALGVDANMTREIAEAFVDTVYIYDDERIEVKFLFDNLLARTMNESEKKAD